MWRVSVLGNLRSLALFRKITYRLAQGGALFICDVAIPASLVASPRPRWLCPVYGVRCARSNIFCFDCVVASQHVPLVRGEEKKKGEVVGGKAGDGPVSLTLAGSLHTGLRTHIAILSLLSGLVSQVRHRRILLLLRSLAFHLASWFVFLQAAHLAGNAVGSRRCTTTPPWSVFAAQAASGPKHWVPMADPRLRAPKHSTPHSSPSCSSHPPGQTIEGSSRKGPYGTTPLMIRPASFSCQSRPGREFLVPGKKKTGWLAKIEVPRNGRRNEMKRRRKEEKEKETK
ncbi:hypothetical protein LZ30DRAFT_449041 [Colletotrichum cereale]|nr:hypothetical protein LZ30DRAFT_449041 [Colletotrichum cereale]